MGPLGRFAIVAALATSLLPAISSRAAPPKEPLPAEDEVQVSDPKLKTDIDACLEKGVAWLKAQQGKDGSFPGFTLDESSKAYAGGGGGPLYMEEPGVTSLCLLALLKGGVPVKDPAIQRGFDWLQGTLKRLPQGMGTPFSTYDVATALMAIEARHAGELKGSRSRKKAASLRVKLADWEREWAVALVNLLLEWQHAGGGWRYGSLLGGGEPPLDAAGGKPGFADISATQYALMGLKTATRCGIRVEPAVFVKAAEFLMESQEKEGPERDRVNGKGKARARGWSYLPSADNPYHARPTGSITAAGLVGLLVCRAEILADRKMKAKEKDPLVGRIEGAIHDGLAWLDRCFTVEANPSALFNPPNDVSSQPNVGRVHHGYYLYVLERVGMLADLETIGPGHDWFEQGARFLVARLQRDGDARGFWEFSVAHKPVQLTDTPYAILFLRKATVKTGYAIGGDAEQDEAKK